MKAVVLGLDGLCPRRVARLVDEGSLPNLAELRRRGGLSSVATTTPAQTPVAWSTVATGANPGQHGIFDFVRRNPETYRPEAGLFRYDPGKALRPPRAVNLRGGTPFWQLLGEAGVPSVILRYPCTYPPARLRGRLLAGVGVPDLRGSFGTSVAYTRAGGDGGERERVMKVEVDEDGAVRTSLPGVPGPGGREATVDLVLRFRDEGLDLDVGPETIALEPGEWSPWVPVRFSVGPLQSVRGQVRFFAPPEDGDVVLYASPVQFDPAAPPFPISHPWDYAGELAEGLGPYHTLGMAEDHGGIVNGRLDEEAFLEQCLTVFEEREAMLHHELDRFREGLLFTVFDTPDRLQHIFWRFEEEDHPANEELGWSRELSGVLDDHYRLCDEVVGDVLDAVEADDLVMVMSDHGFTGFRREVHLNAWLRDQGLLVFRAGAEPGDPAAELCDTVDWERTKAYALGLTGVFFNVRGRESQGVVDPAEVDGLAAEVAGALAGLADPETGEVAVGAAVPGSSVYTGPRAHEAADVLVHCAPGYRVSTATALGEVPGGLMSWNRKRWSGDHVVEPTEVPGTLALNRPFREDAHLLDIAPTLLRAFGVPPGPEMEGRSLLP